MSSVASTPAASPVSAGHKPSASAKAAGKAAVLDGGDTFDKALDAQESPVTAGSKPSPRDADPAAKIAPSRPRSAKDNASRETDGRPEDAGLLDASDAAPALPTIGASEQTATTTNEVIDLDSPLPSTPDAPTDADISAENLPAPSPGAVVAAVPTASIGAAAEAPPVSASPLAPIAEAAGIPAADPSLAGTAKGAPAPVPLSNTRAASDDAVPAGAAPVNTTPADTPAKTANPAEKILELPMPSAPPLAAPEETPATPEVTEFAAPAFGKATDQAKPHEKSEENRAQSSTQNAGKHAAHLTPAAGDTPARTEIAPDLQRAATHPQQVSFDPSHILNTHFSPHAAGPSAAAAPHAQAETLAAAGPAITLAGLPVEIAARAREGVSRFDIRLDPPELGRIEVRLDIDREGNVNSRLVVDRSETLDLLRRHAPGLERALEQAGLTTKDGLEFSLRDQPSANRDQRELDAESPAKPQPVIIPDMPAIVSAAQRSYNLLRGLGAGIDIRV